MAKWSFLPWRQSSASKYRPDTLNYGCISTSKSGEFSVGDANNKAVPVMPVGCVIPFAGAAAPTGWLLCQGQAVSRTTYAQLFSVIGTTYGSGDGSTTFNLPDMRGRVAVGSDANLGTVSGANSRNFSWDNLPSTPALATWQDSYKAVLADAGAPNLYGVNNKWTGTNLPLSVVQPSLHLYYVIKV
nr:MAG TPA: tail collar fiber protein [Bacteriophage sp.]